MERPFASKRPIGPFAQTQLESRDEELEPNEIRILIGRLADSTEENVSTLESVRDGELPKETAEMAVRMTRFDSKNLDSAASKLAAKHKNLQGTFPNSWKEYQEQAERRDELLEDVS